MATPVIMPRQGQSVESCIISKWHVKKGDKVKPGDLLFTYETDKATFDEESTLEGTVLELFFEEDDDVPVLTNVCVIGDENEDVSSFKPDSSGDNEETNTQSNQEESSDTSTYSDKTPITTIIQQNANEISKISPRAKKRAEKSGVDLKFANPTGPNNRIIEQDIIALEQSGPKVTYAARNQINSNVLTQGSGIGNRITTDDINIPLEQSQKPVPEQSIQSEYVDNKLSNIRKVIAEAMHASLANSAQLTLNASFDATEILNVRKKIKANMDSLGLSNITITDMILYTVSRTLLKHENLNAHFLGDKIRTFKNVNLGIAIDTDRGLMVPTLFNADLKSLNQISSEAKELAVQCKNGSINPDTLKDGNFTVTNLGTFGVETFTPVLNPPQTGILGVNTIVQRVKEVNGEITTYPAMGLSLTFDHRAIDGAPAARFLQDLKYALENFSMLLL